MGCRGNRPGAGWKVMWVYWGCGRYEVVRKVASGAEGAEGMKWCGAAIIAICPVFAVCSAAGASWRRKWLSVPQSTASGAVCRLEAGEGVSVQPGFTRGVPIHAAPSKDQTLPNAYK